MLTRFRNIAYVMAYAVATIPLWHYIRDGRILALMVAVVTFAYLNVMLSTVQAAQPILSSEKAKTPLPRWLPDKPKYQKWWLLVRYTMRWHILLIPPKIGLAVAFMEWLNVVPRIYAGGMLSPYFYFTYVGNITFGYPQWETVLIGVLVLVVFTGLELGLLTSVVISVQTRFAHTIVKKLSIMLMLIGLSSVFSTALWNIHSCGSCSIYDDTTRFNKRVSDTFLIATNSFTEQGILLAANIMRPNIGGYSLIYGEYLEVTWDSRPFVARQVVAGLLGLLLYVGVTWAVLWFVEDEKIVAAS